MAGVIKTQADTVLGMVASWSSIPNTLITWVTPVLLLGLTILIMWHGYKVIRGAGGQDHLLDVFFNSIRVFLVFSLCLVGGVYASNVVIIVQELREGLTGLFSGAAGAGGGCHHPQLGGPARRFDHRGRLGTSIRTLVPPPTPLETSTLPPSSAARERRLERPIPSDGTD